MALVSQPLEKRLSGGADLKRFLISRLSSLGDVVCSLPAASALKRAYPDCHVDWVVDARFAAIVEGCRSVDQVIAAERGRSVRLSESYDVAFDLQCLFKSGIVVARAKAKDKLGYHWQREGSALFSRRVLPDPSSIHVVDQYVDVTRAGGGIADRAEFNLVPDSETIVNVQRKLNGVAPFVVVNPGSAHASKRWPAPHFAALIDRLELPTVLVGAKGEPAADEVAAHCERSPLNLSGQTSIAELIALISLAKAHVGGDTGSSHLAAALGVPAIGLYSATRPERSCPYGQFERSHYHPRGPERIEPAEVFKTVMEAIS